MVLNMVAAGFAHALHAQQADLQPGGFRAVRSPGHRAAIGMDRGRSLFEAQCLARALIIREGTR